MARKPTDVLSVAQQEQGGALYPHQISAINTRFLTDSLKPLLINYFISSTTAGRLLSSFNYLWDWNILEGQDKVKPSCKYSQTKASKPWQAVHGAQHPESQLLPDLNQPAVANQSQSQQELCCALRLRTSFSQATSTHGGNKTIMLSRGTQAALRAILLVVGLDLKGSSQQQMP